MALPLVLAAGIGAAGGLASSFIQNAGARANQKLANKHNVEFWKMQNAYNHPSKQMARLRESGLNPNLVYGQGVSGATGQAESIAPSKPAPYKFDNPLQDVSLIAALKNTEAQTNNLEAQNNVIQQEAALKGMQTAELGKKVMKHDIDLKYADDLGKSSLQFSQEQVRKLEREVIGADLDNAFKDGTLKNRIKDIAYRVQISRQQLTGEKLNNRLKELEIDLNEIGITKNDAWYWRILGRFLQDENAQATFRKLNKNEK